MSLIKTQTLAAVALACIFPLGAQAQTANSGSAARAVAGAVVNNNGGDVFTPGGIGAAYCTGSVGTPVFSVSWTEQKCLRFNQLLALHKAGAINTQQLAQLGLPLAGYALTSQSTTRVSTSNVSATLPNITGSWTSLTRSQKKAVTECDAFWNSKKVQGCTY